MREDLVQIHPKLYEKSSVIYNPISSHILNYVKSKNLNSKKEKTIFYALVV